MMGRKELGRPSIANNVAIKAFQNRGCGDEWVKNALKQSLLANSSELEDTYSIDNIVLCSKRQLITVAVMLALCLASKPSIAAEAAEQSDGNSSQGSGTSSTVADSERQTVPKKSIFSGLLNTKSWYWFRGNGFSLRVPPDFDDILEPEDYAAGTSLYGERAKAKTFAARFASPDRSSHVNNVECYQKLLKLSIPRYLDVDLPCRDKWWFAAFARTYYFYEFSAQDMHVALEAGVSQGKVFVVGATAPRSKWEDIGNKLCSAAI